jgi:hypothetical protein
VKEGSLSPPQKDSQYFCYSLGQESGIGFIYGTVDTNTDTRQIARYLCSRPTRSECASHQI